MNPPQKTSRPPGSPVRSTIPPLPPFEGGSPALGRYSLAVRVSGDSLFVSGMTPFDPATVKIERDTITRQTEPVLENTRRVLEAAGVASAASRRVYLSHLNPESFAEMNAVDACFSGETKSARATLGATLPGSDAGIDSVALLP